MFSKESGLREAREREWREKEKHRQQGVGRGINASQFAQDFPSLTTEGPTCWETLQYQANSWGWTGTAGHPGLPRNYYRDLGVNHMHRRRGGEALSLLPMVCFLIPLPRCQRVPAIFPSCKFHHCPLVQRF